MLAGEGHYDQLLEEGHTDYAHSAETVLEAAVAGGRERERLTLHVLVFGKGFVEVQARAVGGRKVLLTLV